MTSILAKSINKWLKAQAMLNQKAFYLVGFETISLTTKNV